MRKLTSLAVASVCWCWPAGWRLVAEEQASPRVEWEQQVYAGFGKAVKDKKLLVVYFRKDFCETCKGPCKHYAAPIDGILRGKEVAALADKAVWVWQTEGVDDAKKNADRLFNDLKLDRYPSVVVLEVSDDAIQERGRIIGQPWQDEEFLKRLRSLLTQDGGK